MPPTEVLISAGEASGDMYAARLSTALRARAEVRLFGMGGPKMRAAGVETVVDYADVAVVGVVEVARKMPTVLRSWRKMFEAARRRRPTLAILTDSPGFHLRLSRVLRRQGVRNVYFICPQFWAWRQGRVRLVRRRFVRGLCIFPFEVDFFRKAGFPVDWIGHPLVDQVHATTTRDEFCARYGLDAAKPIVALLPGSRQGELAHHMPVLVEAAAKIRAAGNRQFVLALAPGLSPAPVNSYMRPDLPIRIVENATYDALGAADVAIVSSGTATVETALMGTPMVVVYRVSPLTGWIGKRLVKTPFVAMVNLIAGKRVVPELIQGDFTPERVAAEVELLLGSAEIRGEMKRELAQVRERLGPPGAIERAADIIAGMIAGH